MALDVPKIDADRHLNLGPPDGYFCDELMRWFFHGNSLSDPKDLLIPFIGTYPETCSTYSLSGGSLIDFAVLLPTPASLSLA
jgi:hypothetical protein